MEDITQFFTQLIEQSMSIDIAEAEFKRLLSEDEELQASYSEWCAAAGVAERYGFREFCEQYIDNQNDVWDQLRDYDE